jgi:hypothetical protein
MAGGETGCKRMVESSSACVVDAIIHLSGTYFASYIAITRGDTTVSIGVGNELLFSCVQYSLAI